ncbi:MmcQ/YjbR family DNA-binding protein [Pontibacter qinzhouensis]|uniref:MmcQ/YjbR family DNA-binding protein n=1 Tax=Pontibacter qinzhouensis TaxID=2603253 RepID=A0A5C8JHY2_9BACT|nr:MmcQ/YjbR family DNA-binding protein [Pontibacter qinzhouensis]TXK36603.1 MmcQ/YjbR family DNA-binding protein [Pontibacter qinzhouensis]
MNIEEFREYCLGKAGATESTPFGGDTLVFKVADKIFALTSIGDFESGINLKCVPEHAVELREKYACVLPGYHMNKKHWNTILPNGSVPDALLQQWIDDSYQLVISKLPKATKLLFGF